MCDIPDDHECFLWEYKSSEFAHYSFHFEKVNGRFGYVMNHASYYFEDWDVNLEELEQNLKFYITVKQRVEGVFNPSIKEIPPVIWKIRQMEKRKSYV